MVNTRTEEEFRIFVLVTGFRCLFYIFCLGG